MWVNGLISIVGLFCSDLPRLMIFSFVFEMCLKFKNRGVIQMKCILLQIRTFQLLIFVIFFLIVFVK